LPGLLAGQAWQAWLCPGFVPVTPPGLLGGTQKLTYFGLVSASLAVWLSGSGPPNPSAGNPTAPDPGAHENLVL
jgi:hypothetical protein